MLKRNDKIDSVAGLIWNGILYWCLGKCCQKLNVAVSWSGAYLCLCCLCCSKVAAAVVGF